MKYRLYTNTANSNLCFAYIPIRGFSPNIQGIIDSAYGLIVGLGRNSPFKLGDIVAIIDGFESHALIDENRVKEFLLHVLIGEEETTVVPSYVKI
jgi:hypothetical protein